MGTLPLIFSTCVVVRVSVAITGSAVLVGGGW
jgi:hypothetical protein